MDKILIVMAMAAMAEAHSGTRLYPFYQLTDEMLEEIDLHDGSIDEWYEVGEPSMTLLDFKTFSDDPHDPSNLDFRVWLAWHDEPDRVYAAFIIADDVYRNHNYTEGSWPFSYDSIVFQIDGAVRVHGLHISPGTWFTVSPTFEHLMEVLTCPGTKLLPWTNEGISSPITSKRTSPFPSCAAATASAVPPATSGCSGIATQALPA